MDKNYLTTAQVAKKLGISRVAVHKRIKSGKLPAHKIGRNYVIAKDELRDVRNRAPRNHTSRNNDGHAKGEIHSFVQKLLHDYAETLRLLGQE